MPLSKARMRERKRLDRLNVKPMSNLNPIRPVKPKLEELRHLIKSIEGKPQADTGARNEHLLEIYDSLSLARKRANTAILRPELDADGQLIPEYT